MFRTSIAKNILKIYFLKICLIFSGLFLIYYVSENINTVTILCICTIFSYVATFYINFNESIFRTYIGKWIVPITFLVLVILNISGLIGTLTGSSNNQANSNLLLGAPFYFLSAAAFISDICLKKQSLPSLIDYFVYLCLPFKLLAGPLETPKLFNQIKIWSPRFTWWKFGIAWPWIVLGTFMKFVIANRLAPALNLEFTSPLTTLLTAAIFELKFYFDFAGYSFMGYGFAILFGFNINQNFKHPFFASNIVLFWHRWHISLGEFLRRYILDPNLKLFPSKHHKMIFASSIFLVSALWHGGTLNYALWGLFHGCVYFTYITFFKRKKNPKLIGYLSMGGFFIFGRFLAIDSTFLRLLIKIKILFIWPFFFKDIFQSPLIEYVFLNSEIKGLIGAIIFLILEAMSLKFYSLNKPYHLFRKPLFSMGLLLTIMFFGTNSKVLLYARF
jgi:alginate O-acetyltransferase complex protein AlgI